MIIGIIGAMEEETTEIKNMMKVERIEKKAGMEFFMGELLDKKAVVVKSGIGKVNAAICTQILIDDFNVDVVINTGVAGGVKEDINPCDVVISTDLIQHDVDGTVCNYELGRIPRMDVLAFKADEKLVDLAFNFAEKNSEYKVYKGRIITGDQIIADLNKLKFFRENFGAYAVEMEGGSIAQVCHLNEIPFVVIRSISDIADEDSNDDYEEFADIAIRKSVEIVSNMIRSL